MKLWKEGDRSRDACERCGKVVDSVFERRTFRLESPRRADVPNVLVAVCAECGEVCSVPPQSSPRLRKARGEAERINVRLAAVLEDAVNLVALKYDARPEGFASAVVRHYLRRMTKDAAVAGRVAACVAMPIGSTAPAGSRLAIRAPRSALAAAALAVGVGGADRRSRMVRGILALAAIDAGIMTDPGLAPAAGAGESLEAVAAAF